MATERRKPSRIRRGDTVQVIQGKERGKRGKVLRVDPDADRVVIERLNFIKRHVRPTKKNPQGGVIEREAGVHISNVQLVCPNCSNPTRVGVEIREGERVRFCRQCNGTVDRA